MSDMISDVIKKWPEPQRSIGFRLREMILRVDIGIREEVKWGHPTFYKKKNICSIISHGEYVNLQMFEGNRLEDPEKILKGTGKRMRHIKITGMENIPEEAIESFVIQTVALQKKPT